MFLREVFMRERKGHYATLARADGRGWNRSLLLGSVSLLLVAGIAALACGGGGKDKAEDIPEEILPREIAVADVFDVQLPDRVETAAPEVAIEVSPDVVEPPANTIPVPEPVVEKFTVIVTTNSTSGIPGQEFTLEARVGRGQATGGVTYEWDFGAGQAVGGHPLHGATQTVGFDQEGRHVVSVVATDEDDNRASSGVFMTIVPVEDYRVGDVDDDGTVSQADVTLAAQHLAGDLVLTPAEFLRAEVSLDGFLNQFDLDLIQMAVDQAASAPRHLWPAAGSLGAHIRLIHPALLAPEAEVVVEFDQSGPLVPVRGRPGYATFVVPPQFTDSQTITIALEVEGQMADSFEFEVFSLPAASAQAGERVKEGVAVLGEVLQVLPLMLDTYMDQLSVDEQQQSVMLGMTQVAMESYAVSSAAFVDTFDQLDAQARAAFEQVALANGLEETVSELQDLKETLEAASLFEQGPYFITAEEAASLMDAVCSALAVAEAADDMAMVSEIAAGYLGWFDTWPADTSPVLGEVIPTCPTCPTPWGPSATSSPR